MAIQNSDNGKNMADKVMEEIKEKKVSMRPRLYFVFGSTLVALGVFIALAAAAFAVNVFSFHYHLTRPLGLSPFAMLMPWLVLAVGALSIWGGMMLIKKYDISYKISFVLIVGLIVLAVVFSGLVMDNLGFNERPRSQRMLRGMYRPFNGDWTRGYVESVSANQITVRTTDGEIKTIVWDEKTRKPPRDFAAGDFIGAVGRERGDLFYAVGIGSGDGMGRRRMRGGMMRPGGFRMRE